MLSSEKLLGRPITYRWWAAKIVILPPGGASEHANLQNLISQNPGNLERWCHRKVDQYAMDFHKMVFEILPLGGAGKQTNFKNLIAQNPDDLERWCNRQSWSVWQGQQLTHLFPSETPHDSYKIYMPHVLLKFLCNLAFHLGKNSTYAVLAYYLNGGLGAL